MRTLAWLNALSPHAARLAEASLYDVIRADPDRSRDLSLRVGPIHASFARQRIDAPAWSALVQTAADLGVADALRALFDGESINRAEARPAAKSTASRSSPPPSGVNCVSRWMSGSSGMGIPVPFAGPRSPR